MAREWCSHARTCVSAMIYTVRGFRTYPPGCSSDVRACVRVVRGCVHPNMFMHTTFRADVKNNVSLLGEKVHYVMYAVLSNVLLNSVCSNVMEILS